ncbi:MAG: hypothetical protein A2046_16670 [Bacteroidetes bacterium GWA2_30_7]|nr:MAG: hypothetical protein A2046_16670 [Bacteroidetes bacterium GWA2_30_7]
MNILTFKRNFYNELGYITDQNGIFTRYNREKKNWDEHLEKCKNYIISFCENNSTENIVILGSGWLLDVPIEYLSKRFKKVYLIDVNHPINIKKLQRSYSNLEFIVDDITGGIAKLAQQSVLDFKKTKTKVELSEFEKVYYKQNIYDSSIISLNILNQLDIIIIDYLKQYKIYAEQEILQLRTIIQNNHIQFLSKNRTCLISDIEEYIINKNDIIEKTNQLVHCQLPIGKNSKEWIWKFDTKMRYIDNKKTYFKVLATELINQQTINKKTMTKN